MAPADKDSVTIAANGKARDREIRFCVEGHTMRLNYAVLHFEGGGIQRVRISERLADGGCSARKTLAGQNHSVQSADVFYDRAVLDGGTARVQLVRAVAEAGQKRLRMHLAAGRLMARGIVADRGLPQMTRQTDELDKRSLFALTSFWME